MPERRRRNTFTGRVKSQDAPKPKGEPEFDQFKKATRSLFELSEEDVRKVKETRNK